jgi:hypothetical protein
MIFCISFSNFLWSCHYYLLNNLNIYNHISFFFNSSLLYQQNLLILVLY